MDDRHELNPDFVLFVADSIDVRDKLAAISQKLQAALQTHADMVDLPPTADESPRYVAADQEDTADAVALSWLTQADGNPATTHTSDASQPAEDSELLNQHQPPMTTNRTIWVMPLFW